MTDLSQQSGLPAEAEGLQRAVADDWRTKWCCDNSSLTAHLFWDDSEKEKKD